MEEARGHLREGTGHGIKVAVLDSGIEAAHPGLKDLKLTDDLAVLDAHIAIERHRGANAVAIERLHEPEYPDSVAVVARRP